MFNSVAVQREQQQLVDSVNQLWPRKKIPCSGCYSLSVYYCIWKTEKAYTLSYLLVVYVKRTVLI